MKKSINDLINESKTAIEKVAADLNYYGKRMRETQLTAAEKILKELNLPFDHGQLVDWLNDNKPVKAQAEKRAKATCNKPAANTMAGNETRQRDNIPTIEGTTFLVTSAQNNTVPSSVLKQLKKAAQDLNAELLIMPIYYNKKAFSATAEDENEIFDPAIVPYLVEGDHWLYDENCVKVAASAAIPLTTKQPINSAVNLNNGELCTIVGHPKCQQKTLLKLAGEEIKTAWTAPSCTQFNYLRGRAGSEAENMHSFGAVLVQIIDDKPFCSNLIQSEDGSLMFYDYTEKFFHYNATAAQQLSCPIVNVGDSHFEVFDPEVFESVKTLLTNTGAKLAVLEDICHFSSRSHHGVGTSSHWYRNKATSVHDELKFIIERVNEYAEICDIYITESNHNNAVDIWLDSQATANNITVDTNNTKMYHLLKFLVCEAIDGGESFKGLELAFKNAELTTLPTLANNVRWGEGHIPEIHYNTEFSQHGHKGANGAAKGLTGGRITQSLVLGHTHSPEISYMTSRGGILTIGTTAKMDQGYNRGGGSSWGQSSGITHPNGITQQFFHAL